MSRLKSFFINKKIRTFDSGKKASAAVLYFFTPCVILQTKGSRDERMKYRILNGNALKIIALIAMTFDHVGEELMYDFRPFRIIGRLAFPLFAFMIAEGCKYTKNKRKHFLMIFLLGVGCQLVYYLTEKSLYMGILITFSLSVLLIYALQLAQRKKKIGYWCLFAAGIGIVFVLSSMLPDFLRGTGYKIDYGFFGVLLPVVIFLCDDRVGKLVLTAAGLVPVCLYLGDIQWFSFLALIPLALYNGERGKLNLKYLFYVYYPAHLAIIYLIGEFMVK